MTLIGQIITEAVFSTLDDKTYVIDPEFADTYINGIRKCLLVRIDSRKVNGGYVYKYAPITSGGRYDASKAFEDSFEEVIEFTGRPTTTENKNDYSKNRK